MTNLYFLENNFGVYKSINGWATFLFHRPEVFEIRVFPKN